MNTKRRTRRAGSKKSKKNLDKNSKTRKKSQSTGSQKKSSQKKSSQKKPTPAAMNSYHDDLMQVINARIGQPEPTATTPTDSKPVIMLVHAEWCGHCQSLMPAWDDMEKQVRDDNYLNDNVIIRKIESSELPLAIDNINNELNDDGKVVVGGYPTMGEIYDKKFMPYGGDRDVDSLMNWVKRVAK